MKNILGVFLALLMVILILSMMICPLIVIVMGVIFGMTERIIVGSILIGVVIAMMFLTKKYLK
jgi:hypothetical protein